VSGPHFRTGSSSRTSNREATDPAAAFATDFAGFAAFLDFALLTGLPGRAFAGCWRVPARGCFFGGFEGFFGFVASVAFLGRPRLRRPPVPVACFIVTPVVSGRWSGSVYFRYHKSIDRFCVGQL
jgi:hypothetical protein